MQSIGVKTGVVEFKTLHDELRTTGSVEVDETRLAWVQILATATILDVAGHDEVLTALKHRYPAYRARPPSEITMPLRSASVLIAGLAIST